MTLTIKRTDTKGVDIKSDGDLGLIVVCQQMTHSDHKSTKQLLEDSLDLISSADVFYAWGNASIFIFDIKEFNDSDRKNIADLLPKTKHAVIFNGVQMKGSAINEMYINCSKGEVKVGKKFCTLLTMKGRK